MTNRQQDFYQSISRNNLRRTRNLYRSVSFDYDRHGGICGGGMMPLAQASELFWAPNIWTMITGWITVLRDHAINIVESNAGEKQFRQPLLPATRFIFCLVRREAYPVRSTEYRAVASKDAAKRLGVICKRTGSHGRLKGMFH